MCRSPKDGGSIPLGPPGGGVGVRHRGQALSDQHPGPNGAGAVDHRQSGRGRIRRHRSRTSCCRCWRSWCSSRHSGGVPGNQDSSCRVRRAPFFSSGFVQNPLDRPSRVRVAIRPVAEPDLRIRQPASAPVLWPPRAALVECPMGRLSRSRMGDVVWGRAGGVPEFDLLPFNHAGASARPASGVQCGRQNVDGPFEQWRCPDCGNDRQRRRIRRRALRRAPAAAAHVSWVSVLADRSISSAELWFAAIECGEGRHLWRGRWGPPGLLANRYAAAICSPSLSSHRRRNAGWNCRSTRSEKDHFIHNTGPDLGSREPSIAVLFVGKRSCPRSRRASTAALGPPGCRGLRAEQSQGCRCTQSDSAEPSARPASGSFVHPLCAVLRIRVYWKLPGFAAGCEVCCRFPIDSIQSIPGSPHRRLPFAARQNALTYHCWSRGCFRCRNRRSRLQRRAPVPVPRQASRGRTGAIPSPELCRGGSAALAGSGGLSVQSSGRKRRHHPPRRNRHWPGSGAVEDPRAYRSSETSPSPSSLACVSISSETDARPYIREDRDAEGQVCPDDGGSAGAQGCAGSRVLRVGPIDRARCRTGA